MNRLGWIIVIGVLVVGGIKFLRQPVTNLSNIVPEKCLCSLDSILSSDHQKKIIQSIQELHHTVKNPHEVIQKAVEKFPELKDMQAEICSADTICFHAQSVTPVLVLNDKFIISDTNVLFPREYVDLATFEQLPKVYSDKNNSYESMTNFIQKLPKELVQTCSFCWEDKNLIILKPKQYKQMNCVVASFEAPTVQLLQHCYDLYECNDQKNFKKKNSKTMVEYDIRFKNQIIVKSGGKYGACISFDNNGN